MAVSNTPSTDPSQNTVTQTIADLQKLSQQGAQLTGATMAYQSESTAQKALNEAVGSIKNQTKIA